MRSGIAAAIVFTTSGVADPHGDLGAPGFWIGNVIVMAGVPSIMQAMLDEVGLSSTSASPCWIMGPATAHHRS